MFVTTVVELAVVQGNIGIGDGDGLVRPGLSGLSEAAAPGGASEAAPRQGWG